MWLQPFPYSRTRSPLLTGGSDTGSGAEEKKKLRSVSGSPGAGDACPKFSREARAELQPPRPGAAGWEGTEGSRPRPLPSQSPEKTQRPGSSLPLH